VFGQPTKLLVVNWQPLSITTLNHTLNVDLEVLPYVSIGKTNLQTGFWSNGVRRSKHVVFARKSSLDWSSTTTEQQLWQMSNTLWRTLFGWKW
jgi:hypothetical protein